MNRWHRDSGFTFAELLVAIALLSIIAVPLAAHFSSSYAGAVRAGRRTAALNLCRKKIEAVKAQGGSRCLGKIAESPEGIHMEIEELAGGGYLFQRETRLQLSGSLHDSDPDETALILITVRVTWQESRVERSVELESNLAER